MPGTGRLHLDSHDGADDDERALDDPERGDHVALEAGVAGRVDQVDLAALPIDVAEGRGERHLAVVLVVVPVATVVLLASIVPSRLIAPAWKSIASTSDVLPVER